jgi:hypothetical protein
MGDHESVADAVARFERTLGNHCDFDSVHITVAGGADRADVLRGMRAEPDGGPVAPDTVPTDLPAASLLEVDGGVVAVEAKWFSGPYDDLVRTLSRGGRAAASVGWNGIGERWAYFARDGVVLFAGDEFPFDSDDDVHPEIAALLAWDDEGHEGDLPVLIAVERFTGVRIDGPALTERAPVHRLRSDPDRLMRPRGVVRMASLTYAGDEDRSVLSAEISGLPAAEQRRLAAVIANTMFRLAGLDGDPDAAEAVEWLTHPDGPRFSLTVENNMFMAHTAEQAGRHTLKSRAWRVLATAAHPDPHVAALEAIWGVRERIVPDALLRYDAVVRDQIEQAAGRGGDAPETNNGASVLD